MRLHILTSVLALAAFAAEAAEPCPFDAKSLSYAGTDLEQAKCLLRPVRKYAAFGARHGTLSEPFESLLGQPLTFGVAELAAHLEREGVPQDAVGGPITARIGKARYFVIHDTSTPNYKQATFPADIDHQTWSWNSMATYREAEGAKRQAHVFVGRDGSSFAQVDLSEPWRATKFEKKGEALRGLFLHVENVQPRRSAPGRDDDAVAPLPGFTDAQSRRLALIYVAASVRAGKWLIPAYHAVIDAGIKDGHDDPQNFDLPAWAGHVGEIVDRLSARRSG